MTPDDAAVRDLCIASDTLQGVIAVARRYNRRAITADDAMGQITGVLVLAAYVVATLEDVSGDG